MNERGHNGKLGRVQTDDLSDIEVRPVFIVVCSKVF